MEDKIKNVENYYNSNAETEWLRLENHPYELELTLRMMDKYVKPGDSVLDIGGGPGRYSLYYAQSGCNVTLVDLSQNCIDFAQHRARDYGVTLNAICADARLIDGLNDPRLPLESFDHVFVMGPMYHLFSQEDRIKAMRAAFSMLKDRGNIYISFLLMFSGLIHMMKFSPESILLDNNHSYLKALEADISFGDKVGRSIDGAYFSRFSDIMPFMKHFPVEALHLFAQQGILAPCEELLLKQSQEIQERWLNLAEKLCERTELLGFAEHVMFIGKKRGIGFDI